MDAYLDIETTGLSPSMDAITVVGICRDTPEGPELRQLVGSDICRDSVAAALSGVTTLYTYNGIRFDAVFLESQLDYALPSSIIHRDLMHDCWKRQLYGGLKTVEKHLGIAREVQGVSGRQAVELWWRYVRRGDDAALETLLAYNREDVLNLKTLRERLRVT